MKSNRLHTLTQIFGNFQYILIIIFNIFIIVIIVIFVEHDLTNFSFTVIIIV